MKLLDELVLPEGFKYPREFLKIVDQGLVDFEPWVIMEGEYLNLRFESLKRRYHVQLIPFARRLDNDDIACWDLSNSEAVIVIHDYAAEGWERRRVYNTFWDWFRSVIDEMIRFNS